MPKNTANGSTQQKKNSLVSDLAQTGADKSTMSARLEMVPKQLWMGKLR